MTDEILKRQAQGAAYGYPVGRTGETEHKPWLGH